MPSRMPGMKDKKGLTEEEFLADYSPKKYPQPSLTADICVFRHVGEGDSAGRLQVLLVQRGGHPYLGCWATPGGFVSPGETADQAAARELAEETGVEGLALEPIALYSTPGRDPRGWTISYAFVALDDKGVTVHAGDDAAKAQWFDVAAVEQDGRTSLTFTSGAEKLGASFFPAAAPITGTLRAADVAGEGLAVDHAQILADAWLRLWHTGGDR